jgi:predicted DNA-binding protein (UPF0251 family)
MGRRPMGARLAEHVEGSDLAKSRLEVILQTIREEITIEEACAKLGVEQSRFFAMRSEALQAMASFLEPGRVGRPPKEPSELEQRMAALEKKFAEVAFELEISRVREEIAVTMPHLLVDPKKNRRR